MDEFLEKIYKFSSAEDMISSLNPGEVSYFMARYCGSKNKLLYDRFIYAKFKVDHDYLLKLARHREFEAIILS